jgi:hypothetical protein
VYRTEPSRLQSLALQLSDKIGQLVENNERLLEQRGQVKFTIRVWFMYNHCCGSGMFIPDPDFYPFRIPDLGSRNSNKREGSKKFVVNPFFVATNFRKLIIILFFKC